MRTSFRISLVALALSATLDSSLGSLAPTTPTFVLAWGNFGSAPGQFALPVDVATDASGNVYVADFNNHRIQKFDFLGRPVTRWGAPGSGNGQFNLPSGVATDPSGNVYVTDRNNHRVQKFTGNGQYLAQWGSLGSGNGQLNAPAALACDASGNVYVADFNNSRIQKFTGTGVYLTQWGSAGTGNGQFSGPRAVAVDPAGNVFVVDNGNSRIQKFSANGTYLSQWGSAGVGDGQFAGPVDVASDALGNVYVADLSNQRIQKFTNSGGFLTKWGSAGSGKGQFNGPEAVIVDAAGNVYVADENNHRIQKFAGAGAALILPPPSFLLTWGSFGAGTGQLNLPQGIALDASGNVYVAEFGNNRVQKFSSTGSFVTQWGSTGTGNGQFNNPSGVAVDPAGNVFVLDSNNHRVQKFSSNGAYIAQWGSFGGAVGQFNNPQGICTDAAGNVYVADFGNHRVQKFLNDGVGAGVIGSFGSGNGQFNSPSDVTVDPFGTIYVADNGNSRIQKFSGVSGSYLDQWGSPGNADGQFAGIFGLCADAAGNVYVADNENGRIQKFTSGGTYLTQWGSVGASTGQFTNPEGIASDPAGNLYVVDTANNRIQKFVEPPAIALVSDVGNDAGRQVRIRFLRASGDVAGTGTTITSYGIYRRIDALPAAASPNGSTDPTRSDPASRLDAQGAQLAGWEQVATVAARGDGEYNAVVPTLADATAATHYYTAYLVSAMTPSPLVYYDSGAENGYSIDDPPPTPNPFTASYSGGATHLHWGVSSAPDLAVYRVYRGATAEFVPSAANRIAVVADTHHVDPGPAGGYYKLSAVDLHGNESPFALVGPNQTVAIEPAPVPKAIELLPPHPNPAGVEGRLSFALPRAAWVSLEVYDVKGRRVRQLVTGWREAGAHAVAWDLLSGKGERVANGLYFVRLTMGGQIRTEGLVVMR